MIDAVERITAMLYEHGARLGEREFKPLGARALSWGGLNPPVFANIRRGPDFLPDEAASPA